MRLFCVLGFAGLLLVQLSACGVVGTAASVVGTTVDVAATAVSTTADIVTSPIRD